MYFAVSFGTIYNIHLPKWAISFSYGECYTMTNVYHIFLLGSLAQIQYSIFTETISNIIINNNNLWKRRNRRIQPKRSKQKKIINAISLRQVDSSVSEFDEETAESSATERETEKITQIYIHLQFTSYKQREIFNASGFCVLVTCLSNEKPKLYRFEFGFSVWFSCGCKVSSLCKLLNKSFHSWYCSGVSFNIERSAWFHCTLCHWLRVYWLYFVSQKSIEQFWGKMEKRMFVSHCIQDLIFIQLMMNEWWMQ